MNNKAIYSLIFQCFFINMPSLCFNSTILLYFCLTNDPFFNLHWYFATCHFFLLFNFLSVVLLMEQINQMYFANLLGYFFVLHAIYLYLISLFTYLYSSVTGESFKDEMRFWHKYIIKINPSHYDEFIYNVLHLFYYSPAFTQSLVMHIFAFCSCSEKIKYNFEKIEYLE